MAICEVHLLTGLVFVGHRSWWMAMNETKGFHHFWVHKGPEQLIGKVIAVPLTNIDYLVIVKG